MAYEYNPMEPSTWGYDLETQAVLDCIVEKLGKMKGYRTYGAEGSTMPLIVINDAGEVYRTGYHPVHEAMSLIARYPDLYSQCLSEVRSWFRQISQMG